MRLFADDTMLYSPIHNHSDSEALQEDLSKLEKWEEKWQMGFNVDKCHQLTVSTKNNIINTSYNLHGQTVEKV